MIHPAMFRPLEGLAAQMHMFGSGESTWDHMVSGRYGDAMHAFGGLYMVLFILAVGGLLFLVLRRNGRGQKQRAEEVLKIRFAKGEISREEFEEKLNLLR